MVAPTGVALLLLLAWREGEREVGGDLNTAIPKAGNPAAAATGSLQESSLKPLGVCFNKSQEIPQQADREGKQEVGGNLSTAIPHAGNLAAVATAS